MIYDRILVRYGELSIKGKNRKYFKNALHKIIRRKLRGLDQLKYEVTRDRFYIILNGTAPELVTEQLDKVFGLQSYSLAARCENEIDAIKALALEIINEQPKVPTTFKVETKRSDKQFPMQSGEISRGVGAHLLINTDHLSVDVHNPDMTVFVEVRREGTFIMADHIKGLGGFPVGISGKGLLMISGGIDSPVAGYLMKKLGVEIEAFHFASPTYTSVRSKQKVLDLMEKNAHYAPVDSIDVHVVPFTELQTAIYENIPSSYTMTVMRRMMYRIATEIARRRSILCLINGESVGQVASQTLESMNVINSVTNIPVLRPVCTYDKLDIIKISKKIDTFDISIKPFEDCCTVYVPKNPATKPNLEKCLKIEESFDYMDIINRIVDETKSINVRYDSDLDLPMLGLVVKSVI